MPRKELEPIMPERKLIASKIFGGIVWTPEDDPDELPQDPDFQDGPWWNDWVADPVKTLAEQKAAYGIRDLREEHVETPLAKADREEEERVEALREANRMAGFDAQNATDRVPVRTSRADTPGKRTRV